MIFGVNEDGGLVFGWGLGRKGIGGLNHVEDKEIGAGGGSESQVRAVELVWVGVLAALGL